MSQATRQELEREIERLQRRVAELEEPQSSGLAELVTDAEAEVVEFAEGILGRGLDVREAFFLGKVLGALKTTQVHRALVAKRFSKDPIRAAYAAAINGAFGKPPAKAEIQTPAVSYWKVPDGYDPWAD